MSSFVKMCTGAAALAVVAKAEIEITSSYSRDRVKHIKHHLEKVYGKGLTGMWDEKGRLTRERLSWAQMRPTSDWVSIGGL